MGPGCARRSETSLGGPLHSGAARVVVLSAQKLVILCSPQRAPAPQSHQELTAGCGEGFLGSELEAALVACDDVGPFLRCAPRPMIGPPRPTA